MKKKDRITKVDKVDYYVDWKYGVPISIIKEDIIKLEELGTTHINIDMVDNYGDQYIEIKAEIHRLETDEEYEERTIREAYKLKTNEARELAEYERLKKKFGI